MPKLHILLAGMHKPGEDGGEEEVGEHHQLSSPMMAAAEEMLDAVARKDAKAFGEALCDFYELYEGEEEEEEGEAPDMGEGR